MSERGRRRRALAVRRVSRPRRAPASAPTARTAQHGGRRQPAPLARGHPAAQRRARGPPRAARQVPQRAALAARARAAARHRRHRLLLLQVSAASGPQVHVSIMLDCLWKARRKEREGEGAGDPKLYLQEALLERKLPELDMRQLVDLPDGLDYNEWLASHTLALFDHVNLLYGTVSEFCTAASCADMTGPGGRSYAWYDERGKKSRVAAPQYVDYVMTFTQKTVSDEGVFPTKYANEFPAAFEGVVRRVLRLLFHVVAHMYAAHFRELALLRLHAHLHLTFAHLTALDRRFALLDHKETEVLRDLEVALRLSEPGGAGAGAGGAGAGPEAAGEDASPRRRSPVVTQPLASA